MSLWRVRYEGSPATVEVESAQKVLEGLRDGEWEPSDEVRGPSDARWTAIEDHPLFVEAVAAMEPPPAEHPDETHLDMNPLIDVALVLLIFFILTTTYSSLRRTIDVPAPPDDKAGAKPKKASDLPQDIVFKIEAWMTDDKPRIRIEDKFVEVEDLDREIKAYVAASGRRKILLEVDGQVPWGVEAKIHDAAKGADIQEIFRKPKKSGA